MIRALLSWLLARDTEPPLPIAKPTKKDPDPWPKNRRGRRAREALFKRKLRYQARRGNKDAGELRKAMMRPPLVFTPMSDLPALTFDEAMAAQMLRNERKRQRRARR